MQSFRIYCASLADEWNVTKDSPEIDEFIKKIASTPGAKLPGAPAMNAMAIESYLSALGCTVAALKLDDFSNFLEFPKSVREALAYASEKPPGESVRESYMNKPSRYVRRSGGKRFVRLTSTKRGGALLIFVKDSSNEPIASLKLMASTTVKCLPEVPNGFVVRSGKRQWILQALDEASFRQWLEDMNGVRSVSSLSPCLLFVDEKVTQ